MIKHRTLASVGTLTVAALALTGCAGSDDDGGSGGTSEVSLLVNVTPNLTEEYWNELVKPFEDAHPDIDVVVQNPGAEGVAAALPRLLTAGDAPDVVQSMPPTTDLAPELVDLSRYDWAKSGPLADQYSIDGKYYMAGIGFQLQSLWFYNKTAFEEAGIAAVPTTVEELTAALGKLKDAGWTPVQTGGDWMTSHSLQALGLPSIIAEDPDWFAHMSAGEATFSDTYGDAVATYADWVAKGYIPKDSLGIKYPDAEQAFLTGKTAIYPMGSWFAGTEAKAEEKAEIGVFRAPAVAGVDAPAMGANIASPYSILKSSESQDAAAELVEFLVTDQDAVASQLEVDGNFRDGYEYEMDDLGKELLQIVADTPAESYTPTGQGYGERTLPTGYSDEINAQTQALIGGTSADKVDSAMDDWFASTAG
ncbi:ABC transporter substrate-binding protein [Krasilnikoviella flava]|uniref:Carbohydrate ABC transporter substrate-binding protein, CUT1 family (TC 3.A.1.1.-) n=1 Tax=Krasilnikoviella flava TaxID=526729 RepID=A0A1T5LLZ3_9MICO|nr:extracellular solute-binding protein [Krasilnikoviella flava]SKC76589.1 carbohydrate ABC transporter substrate-binding protein, CUT1 family (TC 3.A.1.1.-) [Krasilnikoviella flava]